MDALKSITTRRSIRTYKKTSLDEQVVDDIIECGMAAPTGFEGRPWHFVKITDETVLNALAAAMEGCEMIKEASGAILVCGETTRDKLPGIWIQDCSACVQNMLLAIHAHGLASVWLAIYMVEARENACHKLLGVPADLIPFALLPIGAAAESGSSNPRKDAGRVHLNKWNA